MYSLIVCISPLYTYTMLSSLLCQVFLCQMQGCLHITRRFSVTWNKVCIPRSVFVDWEISSKFPSQQKTATPTISSSMWQPLFNINVTVQSQARKSAIFSLWRIRQINSCKNTLMNASIHRLFLMNLLGSE